MTDFDAAAALLLLRAGKRDCTVQIDNENNNHSLLPKSADADVPATCESVSSVNAPKRRRVALTENHNLSLNGNVPTTVQQAVGKEHEECARSTSTRAPNNYARQEESPSPELVGWDNSGPSSPIELQRQGKSSGRQPNSSPRTVNPMLYASPGMNGFASLLNAAVEHFTTSTPGSLSTMKADKISRNTIVVNVPQAEEKSVRSPSDSGVSSIHDEVLPPNLVLKCLNKVDMDILPKCVQIELNHISDTSAYNKDLYTKAKMANFPTEMGFNPNKSRIRKECTNEIDHQDRVKNNEASRRSRHKKKIATQLMNIGLEYDRQENRQLYMQEQWLTNMILELEEKALNRGIDPHVVRKLRNECGFQ